jgi:hypothetical protein
MAVPYTFGSATTSIPLSQLDSNFATAITLGNTAVQLGNTITTLTGVTNVASSGSLTLGTSGNTTAVTIDTSQNVGIGSTPSNKLDVNGTTRVSNTAGYANFIMTGNVSNGGVISFVDSASNTTARILGFGATAGSPDNYALRFDTNGSERMRITSAGNVDIGTTDTGGKLLIARASVPSTFSKNTAYLQIGAGEELQNGYHLITFGYTTSGSTYQPAFIGYTETSNSGGSLGDLIFGTRNAVSDTTPSIRMTISANGSIGAPSGTNIYNASDARLKKNIQPLTKGLDAVNALKPVSFNWIDDFCPVENNKTMYGFVAQDTREVDEHLVEGFNDGSDVLVGDLTVEKAMRVNEKFIIPMLTKAIQELKSINDTQAETINALTARVVALETKVGA